MKCSLDISNFLEEFSSLSNSVVSLYFFALIAEEGFLISSSWLYCCVWGGLSVFWEFVEFSLLWSFLTLGGVLSVACQGFLVREACVGVLVGGAGFLLSGVQWSDQ